MSAIVTADVHAYYWNRAYKQCHSRVNYCVKQLMVLPQTPSLAINVGGSAIITAD